MRAERSWVCARSISACYVVWREEGVTCTGLTLLGRQAVAVMPAITMRAMPSQPVHANCSRNRKTPNSEENAGQFCLKRRLGSGFHRRAPRTFKRPAARPAPGCFGQRRRSRLPATVRCPVRLRPGTRRALAPWRLARRRAGAPSPSRPPRPCW